MKAVFTCWVVVVLLVAMAANTLAQGGSESPPPTLHYAPNHNFSSQGHYMPASLGFNLADVNGIEQLALLPQGTKGLVWIGLCGGADRRFVQTVSPYVGRLNVFGFYLADDPNPSGSCPPARLRAEADWIHRHFPGAKTFVAMMNLGRSSHPSYRNGFTPRNSHIDLFGIAPYPCRVEAPHCDLAMINAYVSAAEAAGISRRRIVPIYQAFGGGSWKDDEGGMYIVPSRADAERMFARWHELIPHPVFDMAYSWGSQQGDIALENAPEELRSAFARQNRNNGLLAVPVSAR